MKDIRKGFGSKEELLVEKLLVLVLNFIQQFGLSLQKQNSNLFISMIIFSVIAEITIPISY